MSNLAVKLGTMCLPCDGTGSVYVATLDGEVDNEICDHCDGTGQAEGNPTYYWCKKCMGHHLNGDDLFTSHASYQEITITR